MTQKHTIARRLYVAAERYAEAIKVVAQMITGVGIVLSVAYRLFLYLPLAPTSLPRLADSPLDLAGKGLAVSAAIELAYMLFTDGPDEAIEPVILGIAAALLILASRDHLGLADSVGVFLLALALAVMFVLRHAVTDKGSMRRPPPSD